MEWSGEEGGKKTEIDRRGRENMWERVKGRSDIARRKKRRVKGRRLGGGKISSDILYEKNIHYSIVVSVQKPLHQIVIEFTAIYLLVCSLYLANLDDGRVHGNYGKNRRSEGFHGRHPGRSNIGCACG